MPKDNELTLLSDDEIVNFITKGYHIIEPFLPKKFHTEIYKKLESLPTNPGDRIYKVVPDLQKIYSNNAVIRVLTSLLGNKYSEASHKHCHKNHPGTRSQMWHQDSLNIPALLDGNNRFPDHIKSVLVMYYPQDVESNMGPTALIPGSHLFKSAPDKNASHGNFRDQVIATLKAGSLLVLHFDIWHAGTANTSNKIRYMIKYLFERKHESKKPSWNHNSSENQRILERLEKDEAAAIQRSLIPKRNYLRMKMWNNIAGDAALKYEYHDKWAGAWPKPNNIVL